MNKMAMCLVAMLVMFIGGCSSGDNLTSPESSDPLDSKVKHGVSVSGGQMTVVPAVDNDILVSVVDGSPTYAAVADVTTVVWNGPNSGWYPRGGRSAGFNPASINISVPSHEKGGLICFITKDGRVLWMNTDHIDPGNGVTVDTTKGLISY